VHRHNARFGLALPESKFRRSGAERFSGAGQVRMMKNLLSAWHETEDFPVYLTEDGKIVGRVADAQ